MTADDLEAILLRYERSSVFRTHQEFLDVWYIRGMLSVISNTLSSPPFDAREMWEMGVADAKSL